MGTIRLTGEDLARTRGVQRIVVGDPAGCPVCLHPTGHCIGDVTADEVFGTFDAVAQAAWVTVLNDVWVERPSPGAPHRPMTILMLAAGTRRPLAEVLLVIGHGYKVSWREDVAAEMNGKLPRSLEPEAVDPEFPLAESEEPGIASPDAATEGSAPTVGTDAASPAAVTTSPVGAESTVQEPATPPAPEPTPRSTTARRRPLP